MLLESIFYGNFCPVDKICPDTPEYKKETHAVVTLLDQISEKHPKEDFDAVQTLLGHITTVHCLENEECFKIGLSAGLTLQQEAIEQLGLFEK